MGGSGSLLQAILQLAPMLMFVAAILLSVRLRRWWIALPALDFAVALGVIIYGELRIGSGAFIYMVAAVPIAGVAAISIAALWRRQLERFGHWPAVSVGIASPLLVILWLALPWAHLIGWPLNAPLLAWRAQAVSQNDPYCLAVTSGNSYPNEYDPVSSWAHLVQTGTTNIAGMLDFLPGTFYAILLVRRPAGDKLYNWSYRELSYLPMSSYYVNDFAGRPELCPPIRGFVSHLR